jgi:hypothetical protein
MNHRMKSVLQALSRVKTFAGRSEIPANARVARLVTDIGALITMMEQAAADQVAGAANRGHSTKRKQQLAEGILDVMRAINRTAKSLDGDTHPNAGAAFRMPTSQAYQALLSSARAFLEHAAPIKEALVESALPADFDLKLQDLIANFTVAMQKAELGYGHQVGATEMLLHGVRQGSALIRKLDAVMKNLLRENETLLGVWKSASHIERPPRRQGSAQAPEPGAEAPSPQPADVPPQSPFIPLKLNLNPQPAAPPEPVFIAPSAPSAPASTVSSIGRVKNQEAANAELLTELYATASQVAHSSNDAESGNQRCVPLAGEDKLTPEPSKAATRPPEPADERKTPTDLGTSQRPATPAPERRPIPSLTAPSQEMLFPGWD